MDTTPGPVPVYRALKSQPLSSELHVTSFSASATVGAQLFSPRRHPWNSHHAELQLRKLRSCLHNETSVCRCTTTGMSESLSKNCNSGNSTDFCDAGPGHLCGTTAGMSTSLFTKWFCTSGPEHLPGTTTGMSTSLTKKSRPEHLRDLHKFSELSQLSA